MPDPTIAKPQFMPANQFMIRQTTLTSVLSIEPPPAKQPQPIGSTPLWCKSTPDGSNDQTFYETSTGNALYFPSFVIDEDDAGKPKVKFTQPDKSKPAYLLTITLKSLPPAGDQKTNAASPCPAKYYVDASGVDTTMVQLNYGSGTVPLAFDQIAADQASGNLVCVAHMTSQGKLGEVIGALIGPTKPSTQASLTVTRTIAALGVAAGAAPGVPAVPPPLPVASSPPVARPVMFNRTMVERAATAPVQPAAPNVMLDRQAMIARFPPTGLGPIHFDHEPPISTTTPPPNQYPPGTPLYTLLTNQKIASTVPDVWFLATLSADIISDVSDVKPTQAGYLQHTVPGYDHPVFQDQNDLTSFCYLPDAFKIPRRGTPPFLPLLNVTITGTTLDDSQATVLFTALPVVDPQRLQAAQDFIQKAHPGDTITMQPLPTPQDIHYGLFLPGVNPPFVSRDVPVFLDQALTDSPQLSLDNFQTAFAALTLPGTQYLQGTITVPVGDNKVDLPLVARADDFPGVYFQQTRSIDDANAAIKLVLTNAVESAVQVDALPIQATRAGNAVNCSVLYDPPLPARIAAADDDHPTGGALTVTITPASGPLDGTLALAVDQRQCHVVPDAAGLLRAVLDPNVPVKASTPVTVLVPAALFGTDTDPTRKISIIKMSFLNGNTITFFRPTDPAVALVSPDKPGQIDLTVFDYLLRHTTGGAADSIKYKLAITNYVSGHTVTDSDWRTAPGDNFVLDLP